MCETTSTINQIFEKVTIRVIMVNTYFDFNDYENPIHTNIEERNEFGIEGMTKNLDIFIQENQAELNDDYVSVLSNEDTK